MLKSFAFENLDNVLEVCGFHPAVTFRSIVNYLFFRTVLVEDVDISMTSKSQYEQYKYLKRLLNGSDFKKDHPDFCLHLVIHNLDKIKSVDHCSFKKLCEINCIRIIFS